MPEITQCPQCANKLRVPDVLIGRTVKCPKCTAQFKAEPIAETEPEPAVVTPPPLLSEPPPLPTMPISSRDDDSSMPETFGDEGIVEEKPKLRKSSRVEADDDDGISEKPKRRKSSISDDEEDRPVKKRRRRDDDDDDDDDDYLDAEEARREVSGPAMAMTINAVVHLLLLGLGMVWNISVATGLVDANDPFDLQPGHRDPNSAMINAFSGGVGLVQGLIGVVFQVLVLVGASKMRQLRSHGFAMAAAIITVVPCITCCVSGTAIGVWALVVLNKPEVKDAFSA